MNPTGDRLARDAKVLITGGDGFVGAHLLRALAVQRPGWRVVAPSSFGPERLDVTEMETIRAVLRGETPDVVIHLAGVAALAEALRAPDTAWAVNAGGVFNLVSAIREVCPACRLLHVSSAEVYGLSLETDAPTDEMALLRPLSLYAATKAAGEMVVGQAARAGLASVIVRPFNHIGPGQSETFVAASFAAQIARIEAGLQPPILSVGSLEEERDFLAVEDVVDAYLAILDAPVFAPEAVFNIASGAATRIGDLLEILLSLSPSTIQVRQDPARLRPSPLRRAIGDASRLRQAVGWAPRRSLNDTLQAVLDDQRARLRGS